MNIKFPLVLIIFALLVSCSSDSVDDNSVDDLAASVAGTYEIVEWIVREPLLFDEGITELFNLVDELPCLESTLQLKPDMTAQFVTTNLSNATGEDNRIILDCVFGTNTEEVSWSIDENRIIIGRQTYVIENNRLVFDHPDLDNPSVLYVRFVWEKR